MAREDTRPRGIPFNTMPSKLWDLSTKISYLQRRVIVYSIAYYEKDVSILNDMDYDGISRQLVRLMAQATPKELERTRYWYAMKDYDGSTGFDIMQKLSYEDYDMLRNLTEHIIALKDKPNGRKKKR